MTDDEIAAEALAGLDGGGPLTPFSQREENFDLARGYRVLAALRRLRRSKGLRPVGRKIGFTNRTIWAEYGVYVGSSRVDLQACKLEYSIVSPK